MKPIRWNATALGLSALLCSVPIASLAGSQAASQDDPFEQLKTYDFQARRPVEAIRMRIDQAGSDKKATAEIEARLDAVLADPAATFAGKQEAARFLWIIGSARSVPTLAKLLADEKLSNVARYALEREADPAAGAALRAALASSKGPLLVGIINSLGNRGEAASTPVVKSYLKDTDPLAVEAAITALGKIASPAAIAALKALPVGNETAGVALRRAADKLAVNGKRAEATQIYQLLWQPARPAVIRGEAVRGLAALATPDAPAVITTALKSDDNYLQMVAVHSLTTLGDPQAVNSVLASWSALSLPARAALLTVLSEKGDAAIAPKALAAVKSGDAAERTAAIRACGKVGGAQAVPALIEAMMSGEGGDRGLAREALADIPGPDAEKAILAQVQQGKPEVRAALMSVLVDRPTPAAMTALLATAQGTDGRAASEAIRAVGRVGGAKEHAELIKLLVTTTNDDTRDAARDAVVAIGQRVGDRDKAAAPVLSAYPAASEAAKIALLGVLGETGGDAALQELNTAAGGSGELKRSAIRILAETWGDSRALPTLQRIAGADSDKGLRVQALRGYLRLISQDEQLSAADRVGSITAALKMAERPEEKRQALSALRDARTAEALALAAGYLDDANLFNDAAETILYLAAPQRKNNRNLAAVTGPATTAALDKIVRLTKDDAQRARAEMLK